MHANDAIRLAQFGGGKSSGFGLIYGSLQSCKAFEPRYRLIRVRFPTARCELVAADPRRYALNKCAAAAEWACGGDKQVAEADQGAQEPHKEDSGCEEERWCAPSVLWSGCCGQRCVCCAPSSHTCCAALLHPCPSAELRVVCTRRSGRQEGLGHDDFLACLLGTLLRSLLVM